MAGALITLRQQLTRSLLVVAFLPLLLVVAVLEWQAEESVMREQQHQLYVLAREKSRLVQERIAFLKTQAELAATLPSVNRLVMDDAPDGQARMVREFSQRFSELTHHHDVLLVNTRGKVVFSLLGESDLGATLTEPKWQKTLSGIAFDQVKMLLTTVMTSYRYYAPSRQNAAFVATPIRSADGVWRGVLMVQLRDDWLSDVVSSQLGLQRTGELVLAHPNEQHKLVAAAPLRHDPLAHKEQRLLDGHHEIPANRAYRGEEGVGWGLDYRGHKVLAGWASLPMANMALVAKQDQEEVLAPLYLQRYVLVGALLLYVLLISWAMAHVVRRFVRPLQQVLGVLQQLTQGRWHHRVPNEAVVNEELYQLQQGVNSLADTIESQIDRLQHQSVELEEQATSLAQHNENLESLVQARTEALEQLSLIDPLTSLFNRRHFNQQAPKLWRLAARQQQQLLFLLMDIDHFKEFNDAQGHEAGDLALQQIAKSLQAVCRRPTDVAIRMGGEEVAILALVDDKEEIDALVGRVIKAIELCAIPHSASPVLPVVTVSMGVAVFNGQHCHAPVEADISQLYRLADKALYEAKRRGRNRVVFADTGLGC